jgi:hypothetical protein
VTLQTVSRWNDNFAICDVMNRKLVEKRALAMRDVVSREVVEKNVTLYTWMCKWSKKIVSNSCKRALVMCDVMTCKLSYKVLL